MPPARSRGTMSGMRLRGNRGATTAEYALLVGGVLMVLVFGVDALKFALNALYAGMQGDIDAWP